jgi:tRNA (mo5U34)-methyltransferase
MAPTVDSGDGDPRRRPADAELRERVAATRWFHSIPLRSDLTTPGLESDTQRKLPRIGLPERLGGRSVLDVGTWDGFFAFEAERRGAERVVASDRHAWASPDYGDAGFRLAREALASDVEQRHLDVLDHSPEAIGTFDVVLFLGVLYHMRHPLLALERMRSVTRDLLVVETHVELLPTRRPTAVFYPGDELDGDDSNWWGPNPPAVRALLNTAGFSRVELVWPRPDAWAAGRAAYAAGRGLWGRVARGRPIRPAATTWRAVFHARP